jgi:hypothetical protein
MSYKAIILSEEFIAASQTRTHSECIRIGTGFTLKDGRHETKICSDIPLRSVSYYTCLRRRFRHRQNAAAGRAGEANKNVANWPYGRRMQRLGWKGRRKRK